MEREQFVQLVSEAIRIVPMPLQEKIENVVFVIEEDPRPPGWRERGIVVRQYLLGLYQGVPLTKRGINYSLVLPDKITIFQKPIEELGVTTEGIRKLVHDVVHHEIAHYFGFDEPAVRRMEKSRALRKKLKKEATPEK
ncbi:MAG: metallopeptidase family protein [Patescibacteria group bacterium]|mgnify:FL=1